MTARPYTRSAFLYCVCGCLMRMVTSGTDLLEAGVPWEYECDRCRRTWHVPPIYVDAKEGRTIPQ